MAVAIRLARGGAKKRPYYKIVVADARNVAEAVVLRPPRRHVFKSGRLVAGNGAFTYPLASDTTREVHT